MEREQDCCCCLCACTHAACNSEVYLSFGSPSEWAVPVSQQAYVVITAVSCASMLAQQQSDLTQSHSWSCSIIDRHIWRSMLHVHTQGPRGAVFHILVPPYTMPLHEWHSLSPPTAHADKLISMALPCTSHIANCLLVHGAIFPCTASAKTKHAGGLVHQQLCHYHACRGTVMQLVGVML